MADDPGILKTAPEAPGLVKYRQMTDAAGAPTAEEWKADTAHSMYQAGATPKDIDDYFGDGQPVPGTKRTAPGQPSLSEVVSNNINRILDSGKHDILTSHPVDSLMAGLDRGDINLLKNQGAQPHVMPQNATFTDNLLASVGQMAGDAPYMVGGFFAGATAGAAVPGAGETGVTELLGGGFGASALPEAVRQTMLDAHNAHKGMTAKEALAVATHSMIETMKQGTIGAVSNLAGGKAAEVVAKAGAHALVAGATNAGVMTATATATAGALNGKVPDATDWGTAAALALGLSALHVVPVGGGRAKAAPEGPPELPPEGQSTEKEGGISDWKGSRTRAAQAKVELNLQQVYRQTGITPWEAVGAAEHDPALHEEQMGQDVNGQPNIAKHLLLAPNEPEPFNSRTAKPEMEEAATGTPLAARDLVPKLEGGLSKSGKPLVSPMGAIGEHQIMPGTARQYMGKDFDVQSLFDPAVNKAVFTRIMDDLERRFPGDPEAQLAAYNAGPGAASKFVAQGPGTRLVAKKDPNFRGGIRYEQEPTDRGEQRLPPETQRYLAKARLLGVGKAGNPEEVESVADFPEHDGAAVWTNHSPPGADKEAFNGEDNPEFSGLQDQRTLAFEKMRAAEASGDHEGAAQWKGIASGIEEEMLNVQHRGGSVGAKSTWEDADWEDVKAEILSNVGEQVEPKRTLAQQVGSLVSELSPARNVDDRLTGYDRVHQIGVEDTLRDTYASNDRARVFIEHGVIDPDTGLPIKDSPSFKQALKEAGGDKQGLAAYLMARRAVNLASRGVETGINPMASERAVNDPAVRAKFEKAAQTWNAVNDGALEYSKASGVHSQASIDAMKAVSDIYVTLRKVVDPGSFGTGSRFAPSDPLRRMVGADGKVVNPLLANVDNLRLTIKMADRNRALLNILDMADKDPELAALLGISDRKPFDPNEDDIDEALRGYGFEEDQLPAARTAYASMVAERLAKGFGDNEILVFRDGQPEKITFDNPDIARMLRTMSSPQEQNLVISALRIPAAVARLGTMLDPTFLPRTVIKHQWTQFITDPLHPPPMITVLRGAIHAITGSDLYYEVMAKGGMGGTPSDLRSLSLVADLEDAFKETGTWDKIWNMLGTPLEVGQWIHERTWAANNVGLYLHNKSAGLSSEKAAMAGRRTGIDYAERSASAMVDAISKISPFWITSLRGAKLTWEALADKPVTTTALALATVTGLTVVNHILNHQHDKTLDAEHQNDSYTNVPRWQRDAGLVLPPIAGQRVIIRYPYQYGVIFGAMTDRIMDRYLDKDPHAYDDMAKDVLNGFGLGPEMPTAPALVTPLEMLSNHNFYTGKPLVSDTIKQRTGPMQFTEATTEPAKALAKVLNPMWQYTGTQASPIAMEHLVQGWSGSGGMEVLRALNAPWQKPDPGNDLADNPFMKGFLIRNPGMNAQAIDDFYSDKDKFDAAHTDLRAAMKGQVTGEASPEDLTYAMSHVGDAMRASALDNIAKAVGVQRVAMEALANNKEMKPAEKRQAYDAIASQAITFARFGTMMAHGEVDPQ